MKMTTTIWQDVRYAARVLRRSPLFTATAVLSLAVGIAGTAAIFGLADALFFRSSPAIADPARLVEVGRTSGTRFRNMSYPDYVDFRDRNSVFEALAAYRPTTEPIGLGAAGGAERVHGARVSGNYFAVLGVRMALGRGLTPTDDRAGDGQGVTVITDGLWRNRFRADPNIVGQFVRLNGRAFSIVGVAPPGFTGHTISASDLWIPLSTPLTNDPPLLGLTARSVVSLTAIGRLRPDVGIDQARSQMTEIARDLEREYPNDQRQHGVILTASRSFPSSEAGVAAGFIAILFALVGLVLLMACANVGGMLLARGVERTREVAVRLALGAVRSGIVRLLVAESLLLAVLGSVVGLLMAIGLTNLLRGLLPAVPIPLAIDVHVDWRVVMFSTLVSVAAGVLSGLLPALESARADLTTSIKAAGPDGRRRLRLRQTFVLAQAAMSVLLLVCASLLSRSLMNADRIDPGFNMRNLEVATVDLRLAGYDETRGEGFANDLLARVQQIAGVQSVASSLVVPLMGQSVGFGPLRRAGQAFDERSAVFPDWNSVSPGYFETLGLPIVRGRAFTASDRTGSADVVIVNETLARRLWPSQDPIGQTVLNRFGGPQGGDRALTVVGIARDAKYRTLGEDSQPFAYVPLAPASGFSLMVRTNGSSVLPDIRTLLGQMDSNLPLLQEGSLSNLTAFTLLPTRVAAWIAGGVGGVGLLLASIGIYGITAFSASRRTREIGIRVAMGAMRGQVITLIVRQSMLVALGGALVGLALAAAGSQLLTSLLYGIRPLDLPSFIGGAVTLVILATVASVVPARRAASVNPVEALRVE